MVELTVGQLLSLGHRQTPDKPSLIERFFAAEKPVAKYFNNRGLDQKINQDGKLAGQAYLAILKRHGGKENNGNWTVPPKNVPDCNEELSRLNAKVLKYSGCTRVRADELTDFAATDAEMAALEPFIVQTEMDAGEPESDNSAELREFLNKSLPRKKTKESSCTNPQNAVVGREELGGKAVR